MVDAPLIRRQSLIVQFAPAKAKSALPRLLADPQERAKTLDLVMCIAGPIATMYPKALALYREFEAMLGVTASPAPEDRIGRRSA